MLGGAYLLSGVHSYRSQSLSLPVARTLVVTGAIVLGVGFWWFILIPAIVAILVIYFGVIRGGLEARPTAT
jgi:hypothetical protein